MLYFTNIKSKKNTPLPDMSCCIGKETSDKAIAEAFSKTMKLLPNLGFDHIDKLTDIDFTADYKLCHEDFRNNVSILKQGTVACTLKADAMTHPDNRLTQPTYRSSRSAIWRSASANPYMPK
jgi:hypothetical protein